MAVKKGNTYASKNRKIRQEALREELAAKQYISRLNKLLDEEWIQPVLDDDGAPIQTSTGVLAINRTSEIKGKADIMLRLLSKVLPDLKAVEMSGSIEHRHVDELTDDELANIATGRSEGAAEKARGEKKPSSVH